MTRYQVQCTCFYGQLFHFSGGFGSDAGSSAGDSLGRPDSLGPVDDDEDRIPEELLLKYVVIQNRVKWGTLKIMTLVVMFSEKTKYAT